MTGVVGCKQKINRRKEVVPGQYEGKLLYRPTATSDHLGVWVTFTRSDKHKDAGGKSATAAVTDWNPSQECDRGSIDTATGMTDAERRGLMASARARLQQIGNLTGEPLFQAVKKMVRSLLDRKFSGPLGPNTCTVLVL